MKIKISENNSIPEGKDAELKNRNPKFIFEEAWSIWEALQVDQDDECFVAKDLSTSLGKLVYGQQFQPTTPVLSMTQCVKQLRALHTVRLQLIGKVLECVQYLESRENSHDLMNSRNELGACCDSTSQITRAEEKPYCKRMPQNIRVMLNSADGDTVILGPNGTKIEKRLLYRLNWSISNANITRKILMEVFDREILATHTLSGKPSPAFVGYDKPIKMQLNPEKIQDIIYILTNSLDMTEMDVRQTITIKCADENKMYRQREERRLGIVKHRRKAKIDNNF